MHVVYIYYETHKTNSLFIQIKHKSYVLIMHIKQDDIGRVSEVEIQWVTLSYIIHQCIRMYTIYAHIAIILFP